MRWLVWMLAVTVPLAVVGVAISSGDRTNICGSTTEPATSVGSTSATLNGTTSCGTGNSFLYGTVNPPLTVVAAPDCTPFAATLTGLTPGTTYFFQAKGTGLSGAVLQFTTLAAAGPPAPPPSPHLLTGGSSGSVQATSGEGSVALNGGPWYAAWEAGTFGSATSVTLTQTTNTSGGGGFGIGGVVLSLSVSPATPFAKPLRLRFPPWSSGVPTYSADGVSWRQIPRLSSPELPVGQEDGYFVNADGTIDVFTRHASLFGVLKDAQAPTAPVSFQASYAKGSLRFGWGAASDNIAVTGYRLLRDTTELARVAAGTTSATARAWRGSYKLSALDAAGNESTPATVTVTDTPRPASVPKQIPLWAYRLLAGNTNANAPKPLPAWYADWRAWRLQPFTIEREGVSADLRAGC